MKKIILTNEQIVEISKKMAEELHSRLKDAKKLPIFIGVMKGALPFMMELIKHYNGDMLIDFIQVSSFQGTESTGTILLKRDVTMDLRGRDIVIVEDIVDTGFTMNYLVKYLDESYAPHSITTVALLDKKCKRKMPFELDLYGLEIGDEFVVGFGFDYDELHRNVPYIFVPNQEEIPEWNELLKKQAE